MKALRQIRDQVRSEQKKMPAPSRSISIVPGGIAIFKEMVERNGDRYRVQDSRERFISISQYGNGRRFRDWMYENYGAEIIRHDGETMIRFVDEQMMLLFILKYGA